MTKEIIQRLENIMGLIHSHPDAATNDLYHIINNWRSKERFISTDEQKEKTDFDNIVISADDVYDEFLEETELGKLNRENIVYLMKRYHSEQLKLKPEKVVSSVEEFLKSRGISKPTYEGVRLVNDKMDAIKIVDIIQEYSQAVVKSVSEEDIEKQANTKLQLLLDEMPIEISERTYPYISEYGVLMAKWMQENNTNIKRDEDIIEAYKIGFDKGFYRCKSDHALKSNFKPDKFIIDVEAKNYLMVTYQPPNKN